MLEKCRIASNLFLEKISAQELARAIKVPQTTNNSTHKSTATNTPNDNPNPPPPNPNSQNETPLSSTSTSVTTQEEQLSQEAITTATAEEVVAAVAAELEETALGELD